MEIEFVTITDLNILKRELISEIKNLLLSDPRNQDKKWLKSRDIQKLLGISAGTLQTLRNRDMIPFTRLGGIIYYNHDEVKKALDNPKTNPRFILGK